MLKYLIYIPLILYGIIAKCQDSATVKVPMGASTNTSGYATTAQVNARATTTTTDSMRTNIYTAINGKQPSGSYAGTVTTDSMRTNIYNAINARATITTTDSMRTNIYTAINGKQATLGAGSVTNSMLAGSIDLATKVTGILPFANNAGTTAATSATSGTMTVNMTTTIITITPTNACTFNGSGGVTGQRATFVITTSGSSSFTLTWGTNYKTVGTLATGTTTAKIFCVSFLCTNGTQWVETGRTAAQ